MLNTCHVVTRQGCQKGVSHQLTLHSSVSSPALRAIAAPYSPLLSGQGHRCRGWPLASTFPLDVQVVEASEPVSSDAAANVCDTQVLEVEPLVPGDGDIELVGDGSTIAEITLNAEMGFQPVESTVSPASSLDPVDQAMTAALERGKPATTADKDAPVSPSPQPPPPPLAVSETVSVATSSTSPVTERDVLPASAAAGVRWVSPPLGRAPEVDLPLAALVSRSTAAPSRPPRPFPPSLDLQRIADALLGEPTIGPIFNELFTLSRSRQAVAGVAADTSAGPLLYTPRFPRPAGSPPASSLPLLVYLPGIDGTGLAAYRQFPGLSSKFDLRGVFLPPEDRTPFHGLVESLAKQLEDEVATLDPSRPVYLLGESFGGLLALELAQRVSCVDRLVLVNPATSFDRSPWPSLGPLLPALPPDLYRLLPVALSPILSNPLAMAAWNISNSDPLPQQGVDLLYGLMDLLPELSSLRVVLPPETLGWRLQLLRQGAEAVNGSLGKVRQRTLLLVGEMDMVIPSAAEAARLEAALPRCHSRVVPGGSHALLQEASVDLVRLLQDEDFYIPRRRLTRPNVSSTSSSAYKPALGGANFGTAGPLELPTPGELRRVAERSGLTDLRRLVSPVFLSTDPFSGRVQRGLGALPPTGSGPMLFVGNHQLFAPDMPLMVEEFLATRGQLLRGLAHPTALGMKERGGSSSRIAASNARFGRLLETFGAVPVGGRNLYQLLQGGEAALLYPGGVREALKLRDEQYELIWPRRAEFVRMACKLGATVIPFAAVGAEDSLEVLLDRRDLLATPGLGEWLRQQQDGLVLARRGVSASDEVEESFIPPLVAPKPPARFYYLFGAPIRTDPRVAEDREATSQLYARVRSEVEGCLGYLLRKREQDPYKELLPRLLYEARWGRQAPSFEP